MVNELKLLMVMGDSPSITSLPSHGGPAEPPFL